MHAPRRQSFTNTKQKPTKLEGKLEKSTLTVGDVSTSRRSRSSGQKTSKDVEKPGDSCCQPPDLVDTFRVLHLATAAYTFFTGKRGPLPWGDPRTHLSKFKFRQAFQAPCFISFHFRFLIEVQFA